MHNMSNSAWQRIQQITNHLIQDAHEIQAAVQQLQMQSQTSMQSQNIPSHLQSSPISQMSAMGMGASAGAGGVHSSALNAIMNTSHQFPDRGSVPQEVRNRQQGHIPSFQPQQQHQISGVNQSAFQQIMSTPNQISGGMQQQANFRQF